MSNRLRKEKSPYLLQHKNNPVDWYPWGDEAFARARAENKPIFLSIGYATCHWCHVMERESFEDPEIAAMMNETFINIKVDREERPDLDATYMTVCQLINGHGGWPLTIIMNPEKEPFFASTYIPKEARFNRIGLRQLIPGIQGMWQKEPKRIQKAIEQIQNGFKHSQVYTVGPFPGTEAIDLAASKLAAAADLEWGGFGAAPKFPTPHNLMFLLRQYHYTTNREFLDIVTTTLTRMRLGGIWDHVGYGFHRYSTDREWLLPHFEKMLYDQALLMMAYTEAWQLTHIDLFRQTVFEIAEYVQHNLMSPEGAFYSAEDADSDGEEGKFYVFEADELRRLLPDEFDFLVHHFGVQEEGNYKEESTQRKTGQNILHLKEVLPPDHASRWERIREKLYKARLKKTAPLLDDKILTDWNALMIAAFAKAGAAFQRKEYIKIAERSFAFLETNLWKNNELFHRFKNGEAAINAFADDYQYLIWASLELYTATFHQRYLDKALTYMQQCLNTFWDNTQGGFYLSVNDNDQPLGRQKQIFDGALPSANSVGLLNLLKLARITGNTHFEQQAETLGTVFSHELLRSGSSITMGMIALQFLHHTPGEIVVVAGNNNATPFLEFLQKTFLPSKVILFKSDSASLKEVAPFTQVQHPINDNTCVYICENHTCKKPLDSLAALQRELMQE